MAKIRVNYPNIPKRSDFTEDQLKKDDSLGTVEVAHLGLFPNGQTSTVDDERVIVWQLFTGGEWPQDGTLVLDHSEATSQRKSALDVLTEESPEEAKEVKSDIKAQSDLTLSDEKGGAE